MAQAKLLGDAILAENDDMLIIVPGLDQEIDHNGLLDMNCKPLELEDVNGNPVKKVVYSVSPTQKWFDDIAKDGQFFKDYETFEGFYE